MDVVEKYADIIASVTDSPKAYIYASAFHLLSSTLGRFIICPFYPRPPDNPMKPNLWIMLSGVPGIMRKSTILNLETVVFERTWINYFKAKYPRMENTTVERLVRTMLIETGSPEGIADHISEHQDEIDTFILMSHEWGHVLEGSQTREYMYGLLPLLSKLWAGEPHIWRGAKKTRYIRKGLYVTAILCIQQPWVYITERIFRQGLMRRILMVYCKPEDKTSWLPPLDMRKYYKISDLDVISSTLSELMISFSEMEPIIAHFEQDAINKINEFAKKVEEEIITQGEPSSWSLYSQNLWDHLTRLSILRAASLKKPEYKGELGYILKVSLEDVNYSLRFLKSTINRAKEAIVLSSTKIVERPLKTSRGPLETVETIVKSRGEDGIKISELLRETGILKEDLKKYVETLIEQGKIFAMLVTRGRGRSFLKLFDKAVKGKVALQGKEITVSELKLIWK